MPAWVSEGWQEYARRLPPECHLQLVEIAPGARTKGADLARSVRDEGERMLGAIPKDTLVIALDADEAGKFLTGLRRRVLKPDLPVLRVYGPEPGEFLGSAHLTAGELIADRLMSPIEVRALRPGATGAAEPPDRAPAAAQTAAGQTA